MLKILKKSYSHIILLLIFTFTLFLTGCEEKAKLIQAAANQYKVSANLTIDKIDELLKREIKTKELDEEKAKTLFVEGIFNLDKKIKIQEYFTGIDPSKTEHPLSDKLREELIGKLKKQYNLVASMVRSLDKGSYIAISVVKDAVPPLKNLNAQLLAFSGEFLERPVASREHTLVFAKIRKAQMKYLNDKTKYSEEMARETIVLRLEEAYKLGREIYATDKRMTHEMVAQALATAAMGEELIELCEKYDQLTLDDIINGLNYAFKLASEFQDIDLSQLKDKTNQLVEVLSDDKYKPLFNATLKEIDKFRKS